MSNRTTEDIIGALYDTVQDARSVPLASDKCIVERDRILDMLDEIIAQLPGELETVPDHRGVPERADQPGSP